MHEPTPKQAREFYKVLRQHVEQIAGGEQIVRQFERDPTTNAEALTEFLHRHAREDDDLTRRLAAALSSQDSPQFVTEVSGGHVDQIVNIAKLGVLQLTIKRQLFLFRDVRQLLVVLLSVALVAGGISYALWYGAQPSIMDGEFNIAVAEFGEIARSGVTRSQTAAELSDALFNFLESELENPNFNLDVQVDHRNIGVITEREEAERLAERIDADVIIYGTVRPGADVAELDPQFFIREQPDTEELTGQNRMGHPIPFTLSQTGYGDEVNQQMRSRAAVLMAITKGLVFLKAENAASAQTEFMNAKNAFEETWGCTQPRNDDDTSGCEVLYLLLALAQGANKDFDAAEKSLSTALDINPDYARAYIGLGNLYYSRAVEQEYRTDYLEQAREFLSQALIAEDAPTSALVLPKAKLNLANVYVVQAQLTQDETLYAKATSLYEEVIAEYTATTNATKQQRLREPAAIAYFGLGAAYERQLLIDEAIDAYQQCMALTTSPNLKTRVQQHIEGIRAEG